VYIITSVLCNAPTFILEHHSLLLVKHTLLIQCPLILISAYSLLFVTFFFVKDIVQPKKRGV
jgi:hypothetical protein